MRRSMFRTLPLLLLPIITALPVAAEDQSNLFNEQQYLSWIETLASDEFEGRGTGQVGIDKAADYIAEVWSSMGVLPGGDLDTFFQNFELPLSQQLGPNTRLTIGTKGRTIRVPALADEEFVPLPWSSDESFEGNVVFAGYGIINEDMKYDDYADLDVEGKVVMVLRRAPDFESFPRGDQAFVAKAMKAKERGAVALLIVNKNGNQSLYDFTNAGRGRDYGIPMFHITPPLATRMLNAAGEDDIESIQRRIDETKQPYRAALEGVSIKGRAELKPVLTPVKNVVGIIPGSGPQSDEYIVMGGHYDHLGIRNKGKPNFNPETDISNGADDNASGIAMLINFAKIFTRDGNRPNRTLVLIAFTAEEIGLLGSRYYADNPTIDLDKAAAMLNFDMVGRLKDNKLDIGGMRTGNFEDLARELAAKYDIDIQDGGGGQGPSDHTHFYRKEVPVMFFFTGIHPQYHRPQDDTPLINEEGSMRIARLATDIIRKIDADPEMPEFVPDTRRTRISRQDQDTSENRSRREERVARREQRRERTEALREQRRAEREARSEDQRPLRGPRREGRRDQRFSREQTAPSDQRRVTLGVRIATDEQGGVLLAEVMPNTPAQRAGLLAGDRVIAFDGKEVAGIEDLVSAVQRINEGDEAKLTIVRNITVNFDNDSQAEESAVAATESFKPNPIATLTKKIRKVLTTHQEQHQSGKVRCKIEGLARDRNATITLELPDESSHLLIEDVAQCLRRFAEDEFELVEGETIVITSRVIMTKDQNDDAVTVTFDLSVDGKAGKSHRRHAHTDHDHHDHAHAGSAHAHAHGERPKPAREPRNETADDDERPERPVVSLQIRPTYGGSDGEGYEISGVIEGGAAARAGMRGTDRIYSIGGRKVTDIHTYMEALRPYKPGEKIEVIVLRDGEKVTLTVKGSGVRGNAPA